MAYNNGFPMNYQQIYPQQQQQFQQVYPQQQMMQPMQQPLQQPVQQQQYPVVQGGFVRVRNENDARMYPVAPGNSVTFIDEVLPYCYTKTVNMGQLDRPIFEKYRLVKEEDAPIQQQPVEQPQRPVEVPQVDTNLFVTKDIIDSFKSEIDAIKGDIETFRADLYGLAGKKKTAVKKENSADE